MASTFNPAWMTAPDEQQQLLDLQNQQAYAEQLRQQSLEGQPSGNMVGRIYVAPSWTQQLAAAIKGPMASYIQKGVIDKTGALNKEIAAKYATILNGGAGNIQGTYQAPDGTTIGATGNQSVPMPQGQSNGLNMANLIRGNIIGQIGGDQASSAYYDQFKPTGEMKNWAAQGINPQEMRPYTLGAAIKGSTIEMQPGTTARNLATGEERFQPKVGEGINLNNGVASQVPGYAAANAGIQGAQTQAQEQAKAGLDMVTVNTPQGPFMMTRDQASRLAQGSPQGNPSGDFRGNGQQIMNDIASISDPQERANALAAFRNQGTAGIPLQDEEGKASATKRGDFFGGTYTDLQKGAMEANAKISKLDRISNLLDGVKTGKLTPTGTQIAGYARALGLDVDPNLGNKQAALALGNEIALTLRNPSGGAGMPGSLSDSDREFLRSMSPNLANTPEGNKTLIETMKKLAQRDQEVAKLAREYNGGKLDNGFFQKLQDYSNANPLFPKTSALPQMDAVQAEMRRRGLMK